MNFEFPTKVKDLQARVTGFMEGNVYPNEKVYEQQLDEGETRWQIPPIMEELKAKAKSENLWNLFLPESERGYGLSNLEYAPLCEIMGRSPIGAEVFNCSAPDTGNMEVLERYGLEEHKKQWLEPLLNGDIRSAFAMTEPGVASSDATNIESSIVLDGDEYVINGRKWWSSGVGDPRCKVAIVMGKSDTSAQRHQQHDPDVIVGQVTPQQGADRNRQQDHGAAHGRRTCFGKMRLWAVVANGLANLPFDQATYHPGPQPKAQHQRGERGENDAQRQIIEHLKRSLELS